MKGIILAGGKGTRLYPLTNAANKHLLPVYNKPMIYYPLSVLMLTGIREILLISTPVALPTFQKILGDGFKWGLSITYAAQTEPRGIADAFLIAEEFIGRDTVSLILGDNIFYGSTLSERLQRASNISSGALVFAYQMMDPGKYAVVEFSRASDGTHIPVGIQEKPHTPRSMYAIPGLYFYDNQVIQIAKSLRPSTRGELEITDVNKIYLNDKRLVVEELGRGIAWLDAGTHETLHQAANFVQAVEERQGMMISCPEEIAFHMGYISRDQFEELIKNMPGNYYKQYLASLIARLT
jgi:glucose-1-phosphate thymidylyltransferase